MHEDDAASLDRFPSRIEAQGLLRMMMTEL